MFETLKRSYNLFKQSFSVLRSNPTLVLFPLLSLVCVTIATFGVGVVGLVTGSFGIGGEDGFTGLGVLLILLFYFSTYFFTIYFQVALVACVKRYLEGGKPTLGHGVQEASARLGAIVSWAIIAASVGLLLRILEEVARRNTQGFGRFIAEMIIGMLGMAWSLLTFFVIPILAYDRVGGVEALKRSGSVVKRRWGEAVVGGTGIGLVMWVVGLVVIVVLGGIGFIALSSGGTAGLVVGLVFIALAVLALLVAITLTAALQSIYTTVLYTYATTGQAGSHFSRELLDGAFKSKPAQA